jgi:DNA-binding beta-propeller fold protein YncE
MKAELRLLAVLIFFLAGGNLGHGQLRTLLQMAQENCVSCFKAKASNVAEIPFKAAADFLKIPSTVALGAPAGVARNSRGHLFVLTRSGGTRLLEFDEKGAFVREIGKDLYGFALGNAVRIDSQDNIWAVDAGATMVIQFNPRGRVEGLYGRRPHPHRETHEEPAPPGDPAATPYWLEQPVDVTWDAAGNVYIADGYLHPRIVKYDKNGRLVKTSGTLGSGPGQFNGLHSMAADAKGNLYIADRNNGRIQVLDSDLNFKAAFDSVGLPAAICITPGPRQYLYSSNSSPENSSPQISAVTGEIYKMELDGTIVGKFGKAGKQAGELSAVHQIDCRNENEIIVAETAGWRVQRLTLQSAVRPAK